MSAYESGVALYRIARSVRRSHGGCLSGLPTGRAVHGQASEANLRCTFCETTFYRVGYSVRCGFGGCLSQLPNESAASHRQASIGNRCCKFWGVMALFRMVYSVRRSNRGRRSLLPTEPATHSQASDEKHRCRNCGEISRRGRGQIAECL